MRILGILDPTDQTHQKFFIFLRSRRFRRSRRLVLVRALCKEMKPWHAHVRINVFFCLKKNNAKKK